MGVEIVTPCVLYSHGERPKTCVVGDYYRMVKHIAADVSTAVLCNLYIITIINVFIVVCHSSLNDK